MTEDKIKFEGEFKGEEIKYHKGDCFFQACESLKKNSNWKFCFGYVYYGMINKKGEKELHRVLHAWNEDDKYCYDYSNNQKIKELKKDYYKRRQLKKGYVSQTKEQVWKLLKQDNRAGWWCEQVYNKKFN